MSLAPDEIGSGLHDWRVAAVGILLGCVAAGMVAAGPLLLDPVVDRIVDFPLSRVVPFAPILGVGAILLVCGAVMRRAEKWFRARYRILSGILILFAAIPAAHYGPLHPSGFALVLVLLLLLPMLLVEHRPVPMDPVVVVLVAVMTVFVFTAFFHGGLFSLFQSYSLLTKFAVLLLMPILVANRSDLEFSLRLFIVLAIASSLMALASVVINIYTGYELNFADIIEYKMTPLGRLMRTTAFFSTTQGLAHALLLATSLVLFCPWRIWVRLLIVGLLTMGMGSTFSAGGLIAAAVVLLAAPFMLLPSRSVHLLTLYLGTAAGAYASGAIGWVVRVILLPLGEGNGEERLEFTRFGIAAVKEAPLLGHGVKSIGRLLNTAVHDAYLQMAADIGVIGGLAFTGLLVYLVVRGIRPALARDGFWWNQGLFVGSAALCWHLVSEPFYDNTLTWLFLGLALCGILIYSKSSQQERHEQR